MVEMRMLELDEAVVEVQIHRETPKENAIDHSTHETVVLLSQSLMEATLHAQRG